MKTFRSFSLQSKLLAAVLALVLSSIALVAWLGYASARDSLRAAATLLEAHRALGAETASAAAHAEVAAGTVIEGLSLQVRHGDLPAEIATVRPGELFGEAGLHGAQRTEVRAVARRDRLCVLLAPDAVREMLERDPSLARELGHAFEVRRRTAAAVRSAPPPAAPAQPDGISPLSSPPELS